MKTSFVFIASVLLFSAVAVQATETCSCTMPESCLEGFETETTPMMKAYAEKTLDVPNSPYSWTVFTHTASFRGCPPSTEHFVVKTPKTAGACGLTFTPGSTYLLTASLSGSSTPPPSVAAYGCDVYSAVSCNFNKEWESVPYETQTTLYDTPAPVC